MVRCPSRMNLHILLDNLFYIRRSERCDRIKREQETNKMEKMTCSEAHKQRSHTRCIRQSFAKHFFSVSFSEFEKKRFRRASSPSSPPPLAAGKKCSSHIHAHIYTRCPRDAIMTLEQKQISNNSLSVVFNTQTRRLACVRACVRKGHAHVNISKPRARACLCVYVCAYVRKRVM